MSHRKDGVLTADELSRGLPTEERLRLGPIAVIECVENIPCNPCVDACPRGAISIEGDVNGTPSVDGEKCNGCRVCLSACPGLAIFVVDASGEDERPTGRISVPYEYLPLPEKGESVVAVDREGVEVCEGKITRVLVSDALDRTPIVTIEIPREHLMVVRHFKRKDEGE